MQAQFGNEFGATPQFGAVAYSPFLSKRCIVSKLQVGVVILALIGYCGPSAGTALGQAVPVTWDNGYPAPINAPPFQNIGSIEVFGTFNGGNLGIATAARFEWVLKVGGTPQTVMLDYPANAANGKFGKRNLNNVIVPVKVAVSKGIYHVKVEMAFSKANPVQGAMPPMIVTASQTQIIEVEVK